MDTTAVLACVALVLMSGAPMSLAQNQAAASSASPSEVKAPGTAEPRTTLDVFQPAASTSEVSPPPPTVPSDPLLIKDGPWTIKFGLFAGTQIVAESNGF